MAVFLIDYENVYGNNGLKGIQYLQKHDTMIMFYSESCQKIRAEYMNQILQ